MSIRKPVKIDISGNEDEEMKSLLVERFKAEWPSVYLSILGSINFSPFFCAFLRGPIFREKT
jgi:hypothetical protein